MSPSAALRATLVHAGEQHAPAQPVEDMAAGNKAPSGLGLHLAPAPHGAPDASEAMQNRVPPVGRPSRWISSLRRVAGDLIHTTAPHEFQAGALEIVHTPSSPLGRTISWIIMLGCTLGLAWTWFGHVDVVVAARGRVIPTERSIVVQAPEHAQVARIHVQDGQFVEAGAALVDLNPTEAGADEQRLQRDLEETRLNLAHLEALLASPEDPAAALAAFRAPARLVAAAAPYREQVGSAAGEHRARIEGLKAEILQRRAEAATIMLEVDRQQSQLPFLREQLDAKRSLAAKSFLPRLQLLELEQTLLNAEKTMKVQTGRVAEAEAAIDRIGHQLEQVRAEFRRSLIERMNDARQRVASLEQELVKARHRAQRLQLTAPVRGYLQQLAVNAVGGVVSPAQTLVTIVPQDAELEMEVRIENGEVGRLEIGQAVEIKIDSFDFTRYGLVAGNLRTLHRDAVPVQEALQGGGSPAQHASDPVYLARVRLREPFIGSAMHPLRAGMTGTAEVKVGRRRIAEYFLSPFIAGLHGSLKEP